MEIIEMDGTIDITGASDATGNNEDQKMLILPIELPYISIIRQLRKKPMMNWEEKHKTQKGSFTIDIQTTMETKNPAERDIKRMKTHQIHGVDETCNTVNLFRLGKQLSDSESLPHG